MKKETTRFVNAGNVDPQKVAGFKMINPPIYNGSTVLFDTYEDLVAANQGKYPGIYYGTEGTPTQLQFEAAMAELEGGYKTQALPSGINAIITTLLAYTKSGDHILVCDNVYGPTRGFCTRILPRYGVETEFFPADEGAGIANRIKPNTRLLFMESPGSNTFEIQDIPAMVAIARTNNIMTVLDNTWATPLYLDAFGLGVDITIHSVTKYISGHSDVLLGTITVNRQHVEPLMEFCRYAEPNAPQNECYLALRGLRTMPVRLKQHETAALDIANWIADLPEVDRVLHPALPQHPQHHIWKRDFKGSTGLFGFTMKQDYTDTQIAAFVNRLELFGIGYSWGGYKSLITVGKYKRNFPSPLRNRNIFRLYIGLEDVADIKADLADAFTALENG
jgi:cystathionine beta-lyase